MHSMCEDSSRSYKGVMSGHAPEPKRMQTYEESLLQSKNYMIKTYTAYKTQAAKWCTLHCNTLMTMIADGPDIYQFTH